MTDKLPLYERLRQQADYPQFEEYGVPVEARRTFYIAMGEWIREGAHGFFFDPDSDGHSDPEAFVETIALRFSRMTQMYNGKQTQSPIEDMLLGALMWLEMDWAGFPINDYLSAGPSGYAPTADDIAKKRIDFILTPQAEIAGHRVDFLLWVTCGKAVGGVAIECDGHDFHEKTKEQAARDKKRDRDVLAAGYPVMRFSGSEVFRDTNACVDQVREVFDTVLNRVSKAGGLF